MFRNNDISDGGRPVLITSPDYNTTPIVSLAECKSALGILSSSQDALLTLALDTAIAMLDPAIEGWLGRSLGTTTWELQLQSFNDRRRKVRPYYDTLAIPLPYPPLINVVSVKYFDVNGNDVTMTAATDYRVLGVGERIQAIAPLYGRAWPVARLDRGSVRIRFAAGYDGETNKTPPQLTSAICLGVRALLPVLQRDQMLLEDRVEGVGSKRYQNNPQLAEITKNAMLKLLANLKVDA
jgi:uncharacterized phiE125 gp8 family phage protein